MKRILFFALIFAAMACGTCLAEGLDIPEMDYQSLAQLKQAVDAEYYSRQESEPRILNPGDYVVGEDIKSGRYYAAVNSYEFNKAASGRINVYRDGNDDEAISSNWVSLNEDPVSVELEDGDRVNIYDFPVTLSVQELTDDQKYKYALPEGTLVPCGVYVVGTDIPEGSYQVYMGSLDGGDVFVYADKAAYDSDETFMDRVELMVIWTEHVKPILLEEGNLVVVEKDVVMKKQESLSFD